jgi:protein kinase A
LHILNRNPLNIFYALYLHPSTLWGFTLRLLVGYLYLSMPTLGFLKKKRTKESPGSKDPASTTGTSSQPGSPLTPTTSAGWESLVQSQSAKSTTTQGTSNTAETDGGVATEQETPMTQGAPSQQQMYTASPHTVGTPVPSEQQSNLPSINNLINPPQHDGAGQSYPTTMATNTGVNAANGGLVGAQRDVQQLPQQPQVRTTKGKYTLADFEILRTLGTGSFGRVHLVQSKHNQRFYAVKVLKKQQVVKMKQVEHTNDERRMLQEVKHPFLITLWGTFQDAKNIYMVMDFVEGGELFSLLRKTQVSHGFAMFRNDAS